MNPSSLVANVAFPAIDPDKLPTRVNMEIFRQVEQDYPTIFTKPLAYDGRKIAYSAVNLPLGGVSRTVRTDARFLLGYS